MVPMLIRGEDGVLALHGARWGLVPHWWKQPKPPALTFNARSEEAAAKPMWRQAYSHARCLMPAEGWYEWQEGERVDSETGEIQKLKQPYFIQRIDEPIFAFAGLMSWWWNAEGEQVLSCAVLTKAAAQGLTDLHHRMPVVLRSNHYEDWLGPAPPREVDRMIADAQTDFVHHAVSTKVNNARNESEDLVERVD